MSGAEPLVIDLHTFVAPTEEAAERLFVNSAEQWVNRPSERLDGRPPWEVALSPAGRARIEALLREGDPAPVVPAMQERILTALRPPPAPGARLVESFRCGGGLLNLFNPYPGEADDERWPALLAGLPEGAGREAALARARLAWNETPNEVLASLTPAQAWAGTGRREFELITAFHRDWTAESEGRTWPTKGAMLSDALLYLRRWQVRPRGGLGWRSAEAVVREEREETLRWKAALLEERR